jgi:hypothetical protein
MTVSTVAVAGKLTVWPGYKSFFHMAIKCTLPFLLVQLGPDASEIHPVAANEVFQPPFWVSSMMQKVWTTTGLLVDADEIETTVPSGTASRLP